MTLRDLIIELLQCGAPMDATVDVVCDEKHIGDHDGFEIERIRNTGYNEKFCVIELRTVKP